MKPFSDSIRNFAEAGRPFNAKSHVSPRPLEPAKREAANDRREALAESTKQQLAPFTEGRNRSEPAAHADWLKFVQQRLLNLED